MKSLVVFRDFRKAIVSVFLILLATVLSFSPLKAQSERELMDEALKKELGQTPAPKEESKKDNASKTENPSAVVKPSVNSESQAETNPVAERYKTGDEGPGIAGTLFRVVFILALLCVGLYYILKYVAKNREGRLPVRGEMNVLSSLMLGPNKQLQIVEVSGRFLVLGVADNGINLITEISDPEVKHRIQQKKETFDPPEGGFLVTVLEQIKDLNSRISGNQEGPPGGTEKAEAARDEKRRQTRKKLDELKEKTSSLESGLFDLRS